jgi:hypothetical protein
MSVPLGIYALPWHGGGDREMVEGVNGGYGERQGAMEGDRGARSERGKMDVLGSQGAD